MDLREFSLTRRDGSGELAVEDVMLREIAEKIETPAFVYSKAKLTENFLRFKQALSSLDSLVCVSVKANSNLTLLSILAEAGAGFDVVSLGELERAVAAGGDAKRIVFSGVGKTDEEIIGAIKHGIRFFNIESPEELERINLVAGKLGVKAPVAIRVNPDIDAKTHPYISTGLSQHKFGIALNEASNIYRNANEFSNLEFVGVDCHIGSMISDLTVFDEAFAKIAKFVREVQKFAPSVRQVDLGGGLAIRYKEDVPPPVEDYAALVKKHFSALGVSLVFEPGRAIFGNAGVLLTKVLFTKKNEAKRFVVVDAGFNDLIRPLLYQAYHGIEPVKADPKTPEYEVDVVGPICESGDCFAKGRKLPALHRDDLVVICSTGAYGFAMASNYNTRPRPPEVLVEGGKYTVIRPREQLQELYSSELTALKSYRGAK